MNINQNLMCNLVTKINLCNHRKNEDGVKLLMVKNMENPYQKQANFDNRFKLTLNKLYAWTLVDYDRVVMLDSDNLFLHKTDELFQCGQFCAVFINPCIFHTGLFVLQVTGDFIYEICIISFSERDFILGRLWIWYIRMCQDIDYLLIGLDECWLSEKTRKYP